MARIIILALMLGFTILDGAVTRNELFAGDGWIKKTMDPRDEEPESVSTIAHVPLANGSCEQEGTCEFTLHYFTAFKFNPANLKKKNILFIPGGPGQFVEENDSASMALKLLAEGGQQDINAGRHNVVYVHIRGTGQSILPPDNSFDRFLRARHVIHDIERLRKELLGDKPWDAIYAHSWGTVVAQMYAQEFGAMDKVKSLILSAPITRTRSKSQAFRTRQTGANLESIFKFYKPDAECSCVAPTFLSERVVDFKENQSIFGASDNLCFFAEHVSQIRRSAEDVLDRIGDDYGSLDFVIDNFDALKNEPDFRTGGRFPFPRAFFSALRTVQMSGAPVDANPLVFARDSKTLVNAALLIANYLRSPNPILAGTQCEIDGQFPDASGGSCGTHICQRLAGLVNQNFSGGGLESVRASSVFGVYDGVARWVFSMLDKECFTGADLGNFATAESSANDKKRLLRAAAGKIGIVPDEVVCGWDPGKHPHAVPTLILKGTADTIIAGCQAEDFYNEGLLGHRVLLELRGTGHLMSVTQQRLGGQKPAPQTAAFTDVVERFIKAPTAPLSGEIANKLQMIHAEEIKPGPDGKIDVSHCPIAP